MGWIIEQLAKYLSFPFVRYALITGVFISLCSSLYGVVLVMKRYSFIGDGLSHVAFGAMALASVLGILEQKMIVILPITVAAAVFLLRRPQNTKMAGDALIAVMSVGALAAGYLMMNVFNTSGNVSGDVCTSLFGSTSILTLNSFDVTMCVILSVIASLLFVVLYNKIFAVTFDENYAKASGLNTDACNLIIAVITAVIIVLGMNLVGSLLTSALIVFPVLTSLQLFQSFRSVTVCSAVLSVICSFCGILFSILAGTPVGSTIVAAEIAVFIIFYVAALIRRRA